MFPKAHLRSSIIFAWILSSILAASTAVAISSATIQTACDQASDLTPNTVWRSSVPVEEHSFRWLLPSPGIATLDLLATESSAARIDLHFVACDDSNAEFSVIRQSSRHLVIAAQSAGAIYLTSNSGGTPFRLVSSFVHTEVVEEMFDFGRGIAARQISFLLASSPKKVEPEIIDPEPDSLRFVGGGLLASLLTLTPVSLPDMEPENIDPEPNSLLGEASSNVSNTSAQSHAVVFEPLCRRTELDDHGDTMSCATALIFGRRFTGEFLNDWNDDNDVFSFRLRKSTKVSIELASESSSVHYELLDSSGQQLAVDRRPGNDPTASHLVATLAPGQYFLRLTGPSGAFAGLATSSD